MTSPEGRDAVRSIDLNATAWVEREGARLKEFIAHGKRLRLVEFLPGFRDPNWCLRKRCVMTTYDPDTQAPDPSVLRRIVREFGGRIALDCSVVQGGRVSVGDPGSVPLSVLLTDR